MMKEMLQETCRETQQFKALMYIALFYSKLQKVYRISKHYCNKILHFFKINIVISTMKLVLHL